MTNELVPNMELNMTLFEFKKIVFQIESILQKKEAKIFNKQQPDEYVFICIANSSRFFLLARSLALV